MPFTLANYISRIRQKIDDTAISNRVEEDLTDLVIGGNGQRKGFPLTHAIVVTSPAPSITANGAAYTTSGFTVASGILTFTAAPSLATLPTPTNLKCLYFWNHFTDSITYPSFVNFDIDRFIDEGLQRIGVNDTTTDTSYTLVSQANFDVVCLYAASFACTELANRYARQVNIGADGKSSGKAQISKNYQDMADKLMKQAEDERLAAQGARQGRATVASLQIRRTVPQSFNWTPRF